jgi:hypothetical protein
VNNPTVLKSISIIAFIISALFTIQLMTSGTVGITAWILTVGMAIILEACKCGFFYEALSNTKLPKGIRGLLAAIAILLVASSIFASASYVQNQANKTKNKQMKTSSQYKQLEQGKALQQDRYNTLKQEIEKLEALKVQQQQEGDKIVNSMPKNYIDRRNNQRVETQQQIAGTQELIEAKSKELTDLANNLQKPIDTVNLKVNADNGYTAMFQTIAEMINSGDDYKDSPVKAEVIEMGFFIGLGIIFELVAVLTAYLSQLKTSPEGCTAFKNTLMDNSIGFNLKPLRTSLVSNEDIQGIIQNDIQLKRTIGFQAPAPSSVSASITLEGKTQNLSPSSEGLETLVHPNVESKTQDMSYSFNREISKCCDTTDFHADSDISQDDLKIYVEYMNQNQKDGISPGYMNISKKTGLSVECCRKIKGHLERIGIVKTDGARTIILKQNWKA